MLNYALLLALFVSCLGFVLCPEFRLGVISRQLSVVPLLGFFRFLLCPVLPLWFLAGSSVLQCADDVVAFVGKGNRIVFLIPVSMRHRPCQRRIL